MGIVSDLRERVAELEAQLQYTERQRDEQVANAQKFLDTAVQYERALSVSRQAYAERDAFKAALSRLIVAAEEAREVMAAQHRVIASSPPSSQVADTFLYEMHVLGIPNGAGVRLQNAIEAAEKAAKGE